MPVSDSDPAASAAQTAGPEASLQFERLLTDVVARFVNVPADRLDREIEAALRQVCQSLAIDGAAVWQVKSDSSPVLALTHVHQRASELPIPGVAVSGVAVMGLDGSAFLDSLAERLKGGETVVLSRLSDLPEAARQDREALERFGIAAILAFPLSAGGAFLGGLSLSMLRSGPEWSTVLIGRLWIVAQVFANALARRRAEQALVLSDERLRLAAASAGAGLWDLDIKSQRTWSTPAVKVLYGFPVDADPSLEDVLQRIHPEDRDQFRDRLRRAIADRADYSAEHRVVLPDGSIRWLNARGRAWLAPSAIGSDRLMGATIDVTDRKLAELQLKEHEALLAAAIDAAGLGLYEMSDGTRLVHIDERVRALFGVPADHDPGGTWEFWRAHLHPDDRDHVLKETQRVRDGDIDHVSMEYRVVRPDGSEVWLGHDAHARERDAGGRVTRMIGVFHDITARKTHEEDLRRALDEVRRLRDELQTDNVYLRQETRSLLGSTRIIGRSASIRRVLDQATQVAPTPSTVLLLGETGTGKERFASFIHDESPRRDRPIVRVNCSAIPATLVESELFGREKGAYTGALSKQIGRFEMAHRSTIFLDEIGELPTDVQVKLLRVLQERQLERLGSPRPVDIDVRIIAATNRNLEQAVADGTFREDLYYRLAVFPITLPPLRDRLDDLPQLVDALIEELSATMGKHVEAVSRDSMEALAEYHWPGNVRELRNVLERAMIMSNGPVLRVEPPASTNNRPRVVADATTATPRSLEGVEREHLLSVLQECGWRIRGESGAAQVLGLKPTTLETRMAKLGIRRPGKVRQEP